MVRKKIDNRIRVLIENGVAEKHRSLYVIVGDRGRDQVVILHHMLSKAVVKSRPSVLWCYKKELGFSSHRKKRMRQLQKKIKTGKLDVNEDDPFELFIASTNIRYCYYSETHKILGNTYGMLVLQDFEAMTPNLLARTVETIEGGGIVVILLRTMTSLKQLYAMTMDVHTRYRTESHQDVVGRFNERFILSLASCKTCMVIDDQLNILPVSSHMLSIEPVPPKPVEDRLSPSEKDLKDLQTSLQDTQPVGVLVNCCKTLDQGKALLKFVEAISEKTLRSTVVMTAARGRGKSAALGLAMSTAVAFGYSNIFVTAPSPENLKTLFEFVFKGFDALEYQEHLDYELVQSTNPEFNKAIVRVNIFREHRQTIQYIRPSDAHKLGQAELVCIDEAAAIPLPLVKNLLGPYLVFMSSTINGYEGTGRSLSLKLIQQLRQSSATFGGNEKQVKALTAAAEKSSDKLGAGRSLHEITLNESIRYASEDPVEKWLYNVLCLDASNITWINSGCPVPASCDLYYVNRDTLFSYHKASEAFLQRIMALYVSSHYKNTPNDLQLLSDAPAHHIFCLLGPVDPNQTSLPEVLCVLQVCLEGEINKQTVMNSLARGQRASGDLIPWTISQQFQDHDFPTLSGARIVRIATHPHYQGMGYGSRAMQLLQEYYEGKVVSLTDDDQAEKLQQVHTVTGEVKGLQEETIKPRKNLPPLLLKLSEREPEKIQYLGVSFGLTASLLKFWKRSGFAPVYLRQTPNDLTGEHSCIMLKGLNDDADETEEQHWLHAYWTDFRRRFVSLLSYEFSKFLPGMSLNILQQKKIKSQPTTLTKEELDVHMTKYDLKRLDMFAKNLVDFHLIMDLLPIIGKLYCLERLPIHLTLIQAAILLGMGLQHKSVDTLVTELDLPSSQILALFNRSIRKIVQCFDELTEAEVEKEMVKRKEIDMKPVEQSMSSELEEAGREVMKTQEKQIEILKGADLSQFKIKGSENEWGKALAGDKPKKGLVSVGHVAEKRKPEDDTTQLLMSGKDDKKKKKNKPFQKNKKFKKD
ncbi:RNA cytidine acetyltransferase-like [Tubulanus polymorphus]|uniref:RNA cytidine acetyltransferase-like n=1 Tax=Tubulanus polymorphus TaxID=672921 RepID=UPI003DA475E2